MKLLAGNSNRSLSAAIAKVLDLPLTRANIRRFADNEVFVVIEENVRGEDVFVIQSTSYPANDNLMELLICMDALTRASARRITAVIPYYGYERKEKQSAPRDPISASTEGIFAPISTMKKRMAMPMHPKRAARLPSRRLRPVSIIRGSIPLRLPQRSPRVLRGNASRGRANCGFSNSIAARRTSTRCPDRTQ